MSWNTRSRLAVLGIGTSLFFAASPEARAFCGTYVGGAGAELYNSVTEVAIVRRDNLTVLTMANDVSGDTEDFAVVVPVPEVPGEDDVHVLEPEVFDRLDRYSSPRLVRYDCSDFEVESDTDTDADTDSDTDADADTDVDIEAEYVVGEYSVVVLSATESAALLTWLSDNDYAVSPAAQDLLQEHLDAGAYFFAAKVGPEAGITPGEHLSPLQVSYHSEVFSLPIRLGTVNSQGSQDLIIYAMNDYRDGIVSIANYDELQVEDECLWKTSGEDFGTFYADSFTEAYTDVGAGAWTTEYAWGGSGCDPCEGTPPDAQDLTNLGFWQGLDTAEGPRPPTVSDIYFTRLHMRYTPEQATQDVTLYQSGRQEQLQYRYIEYAYEMEDRWPICGEGTPASPGSCDGTTDSEGGSSGDDPESADDTPTTIDKGGCTCASTTAPAAQPVFRSV